MSNNLTKANIRIFVFGTLRKGDRLDFYMEGSEFQGMYYTRGQLMLSELGAAYIDFDKNDIFTIGELFKVNYFCLQRIDHLENLSGEFPTGYDIDLLPVWPYDPQKPADFDENKKEIALFYRRRSSPVKIASGSWVTRKKPIAEIDRFLKGKDDQVISADDIINHIIEYLNYKGVISFTM
jgi:gamma-glutamylcyclotransferase (GGCT)/AIG2-like uncharacterized protein YtfP